MANKIGFGAILERDNDNHQDNDHKGQTSPPPSQRQFEQYINARYATTGKAEEMVFRTSRELAYECREMCTASLVDINTVMDKLGFKYDRFLGVFTWVLYDKTPLAY